MTESRRIGGEFVRRPLHFIWILDCSNSMNSGNKIESLDHAIREAIPAMREAAQTNVETQILVRAVRFSTGAEWHIANPTPIEQLKWSKLTAQGETDLGKALTLVAEELKVPPMDPRSKRPVLVLVSDGYPTDEWTNGLNYLISQPWGERSIRIAIAIGRDADYDVLQRFIGNNEMRPLQANNASALALQIASVSSSVCFKTPQIIQEEMSDQWMPNTNYALGDEITDPNGNIQRVTTAGTSGSSEPKWKLASEGQTKDGTITWRNTGSSVMW
jgi:uncharacterized protein YegL